MLFSSTDVDGVFLLDLERREDDRGFFARTWCSQELAERGLVAHLAQCSVSFNARANTLRGLHYQGPPHGETKIVTCLRGAIFDVAVDLRPSSRTYLAWVGVELSETTLRALYVPEGCAHGFQTLKADSLVHYQISEPHAPQQALGVRWNDPLFGIRWPPGDRLISSRDAGFDDFRR